VTKAAAPADRRLLVDDKEGARLLSISRSAFRDLVQRGAIRRVQIPGADGPIRRLLVSLDDLNEAIRRWRS
jgi:hypothetical protein